MSDATLADLKSSRLERWSLFGGGVMLAIIAFWIHINQDPAPAGVVLAVGAGALALLAAGILFSRIPAGTRANLTLGAAGLSAICGIVLASQNGLAALGESVGLGMFAILTFATAVQIRTSAATSEQVWQKFFGLRKPIGMAFAAVGVAALGGFFYLALIQKIGPDYAPELLGLLLGGFVLFFAGMYVLMTDDSAVSVNSFQIFLTVVGSIIGSLLLAAAIARAFFWREYIFTTGAWQGPDAWRCWTVAYTFIAGIALGLASWNLSQTQLTRTDPNLRRAKFGYGAVVAAVLMLIYLVMIVVVSNIAAPYTYDWSESRGMTALNTGSKNLLGDLNEPVGVYVLMSPDGPIFNAIRNFLGNAQAYTNKITVQYIDPDTDFAKYNKLAERYPEIASDFGPRDDAGRGVLLVYGTEAGERVPPHAFIPAKKLFEFDSKGGPKKTRLILKAESEVVKELAFLAKKSDKSKLYILQDEGFLDMNARERLRRPSALAEINGVGLSVLVEKLKQDNFEVRGLSFSPPPNEPGKDDPLKPPRAKDTTFLGSLSGDKKMDIPDDCDLLLVPGAGVLSNAGSDALERYMDRGGKMIVALDVVAAPGYKSLRKSSIDALLKKYGVDATDKVLFRIPTSQDQMFGNSIGDYRLVLVQAAKSAGNFAKQFQNVPFAWTTARAVLPGTSQKYQVDPLLIVNPRSSLVFADDNLAGFVDFDRYGEELMRTGDLKRIYSEDPISVAVTVNERGEAAKPRMVVFGDAEWLGNQQMVNPSNYDLIVSSIEWLSSRSFVGPRPKESAQFSFGPGAGGASLQYMVYGAFWTMLVAIAVVGVAVWLTRRK